MFDDLIGRAIALVIGGAVVFFVTQNNARRAAALDAEIKAAVSKATGGKIG